MRRRRRVGVSFMPIRFWNTPAPLQVGASSRGQPGVAKWPISTAGIATVTTMAMTDSHDMNQQMRPEVIGMSVGRVGGGLKG